MRHAQALFLPLIGCCLLACQVGDVRPENEGFAIDAASGSDATGSDAQLLDPNCVPAAAPPGNGRHNAGANCGSGNCHDGQGPAPKWTLAGTLYVDAEGSAPVAGGTILFTDAAGTELSLTSARNGNFYTLEPLVFPVSVKASRCPNSLSMGVAIPGPITGCNQPGCHDAARRIYLPE